MKNSIMQDEKICYLTKRTDNLHYHHIYFGTAGRQISDDNGFTVWLTAEYHNVTNKCVHLNRKLDLYLRKMCQFEFERTHTREEFIKLIGKNYL